MNPYECQSSKPFSELGSRLLGLNVHQNFRYLLRNHRANSSQILYRTFMPNGTKVYIIGPDHMTKMVGMPIYGKNPLKILSRTVSQMTLKFNSKSDWSSKKLYK